MCVCVCVCEKNEMNKTEYVWKKVNRRKIYIWCS